MPRGKDNRHVLYFDAHNRHFFRLRDRGFGEFTIFRPTLMGTKNLYENGPDPFFFVFFDLMGTRMVQIRIAKSV